MTTSRNIAARRIGPGFGPAVPTKHVSSNGVTRAVGRRVVQCPPNDTWHAFLVRYLASRLGRAWVRRQRDAAEHDRHCVIRWLIAWESKPFPFAQPGEVVTFTPTGEMHDLVALAEDLFFAEVAGHVPGRVLKRVRDPQAFQGARYELAVAGAFARCGFAIEWLDKLDEPRGEFVAFHPVTNERVEVEAKSRHRAGVLHATGVGATLDADILGLYAKAVKKEPTGVPFIICIDVNLPSEPERHGLDKKWAQRVQQLLNPPEPGAGDPFALLILTNVSSHFDGTMPASDPEVVMVVGAGAEPPLKDGRTITALNWAFANHGAVVEPKSWSEALKEHLECRDSIEGRDEH